MPATKRRSPSRTAAPRSGDDRRGAKTAEPSTWTGPRELVVITDPDAGIRVRTEGVASVSGVDASPLGAIAARADVTITPLFGLSEDRIQARIRELPALGFAGGSVPDLSVYYHVDAPDARLDELAEELLDLDAVTAAYVKPPGEPPVLNDMQPAPGDAPPATADFAARQIYLDAAPAGVDARHAWLHSGGGGAGVRIIDCEWGWRFSHEDLTANQGGIVFGTGSTDTNHGTAVIGEISGDRNTFGVTGICPDATMSAAAFSGPSAATIRAAADRLGAGDIILLEIHRAGPRHNFQGRNDQLGYIAIEWWPDDWAAILYATSQGILVVEAAGNGAENLDDPIYSNRPPGFPASWTNPFNRANPDCGAIVVGAGAPPPGTHGRDHGPDRSRLDFSNFGALIDVQGWGREVTTTGYGDLQGGTNEDLWYTDRFSGTSSASPIVTGVLGSLQGALRARGRPVLTPAQARNALRTTGSPQQDAPGRPATQRIGNRPDLRQLYEIHIKGNVLLDKGVIKEQKLEKVENKERGKDMIKERVKETRKEIMKEHKEGKELKEQLKERINDKLDKLENGEIDVKRIREIDDVKTGGREIDVRGNIGDVIRTRIGSIGGGPEAGSNTIEARLDRIEDAVALLVHFIGAELRPDLASGALTREPDLGQQAADAKYAKDVKDKEHLAEG